VTENEGIGDVEYITYPQGADRELLESFRQRASDERRRRFREEHEQFLSNAQRREQGLRALVDLLPLNPDEVEEAIAEQRDAAHDLARRAEPPPVEPPSGHNPARYAPYDGTWSAIAHDGVVAPPTLYGPSATGGLISASMGTVIAGSSTAITSVGFWHYAQHDAVLHVSASAQTWAFFLTYAFLYGAVDNYAALRLYIEEHAENLNIYQAITGIYSGKGILEFDPDEINEYVNVALALPVRANTWYSIWVDAKQACRAVGYAGASSDCRPIVGPVAYIDDIPIP
jgi:hypothetical protein